MLHLLQQAGSVVKVQKYKEQKCHLLQPSEFSPYRPIVHSRAIISFALSIDTLIITLALSLYTLCEEIADMNVWCTQRPKGFRHLGFVSS